MPQNIFSHLLQIVLQTVPIKRNSVYIGHLEGIHDTPYMSL